MLWRWDEGGAHTHTPTRTHTVGSSSSKGEDGRVGGGVRADLQPAAASPSPLMVAGESVGPLRVSASAAEAAAAGNQTVVFIIVVVTVRGLHCRRLRSGYYGDRWERKCHIWVQRQRPTSDNAGSVYEGFVEGDRPLASHKWRPERREALLFAGGSAQPGWLITVQSSSSLSQWPGCLWFSDCGLFVLLHNCILQNLYCLLWLFVLNKNNNTHVCRVCVCWMQVGECCSCGLSELQQCSGSHTLVFITLTFAAHWDIWRQWLLNIDSKQSGLSDWI